MDNPTLINTYALLPVVNVCDQELREVIKLKDFSLAHVIMQPGAESLLHKHSVMHEIYFMMGGHFRPGVGGDLILGNEIISLGGYSCMHIPAKFPHKIKNTSSESRIEHLVFALPPFNPDDVEVLDDKKHLTCRGRSVNYVVPAHTGFDGAKVSQLFAGTEKDLFDFSLAIGYLEPGKKAAPHYHNSTEEIYYVFAGQGIAHVANQSFDVCRGSCIYIPKGSVHYLQNTSSNLKLNVLAACSPMFSEDDFHLVR